MSTGAPPALPIGRPAGDLQQHIRKKCRFQKYLRLYGAVTAEAWPLKVDKPDICKWILDSMQDLQVLRYTSTYMIYQRAHVFSEMHMYAAGDKILGAENVPCPSLSLNVATR